ncbi:MAG: hypothetical protein ACLPSF_03530 [Methylocella sp.]
MNDESEKAQDEAELAWSDFAAALVVDELPAAKLLSPKDAASAREIVAQQLYILLVSDKRP